jgi:hypothetical protein
MKDDQIFSLNRPESYLTNPPGHVWREKWTALSGPLSEMMRFKEKLFPRPEQDPGLDIQKPLLGEYGANKSVQARLWLSLRSNAAD